MIPDESVAYALAAWNRFDQSVPDGLLRAVSGAFVLVAAADGELSRSEAVRFFEVLRSKADAFSAIDFRELENFWRPRRRHVRRPRGWETSRAPVCRSRQGNSRARRAREERSRDRGRGGRAS